MTREAIAALIPHQGEMCLWEHIVAWDDARIVLETHTHRSLNNPLRVNGKLRAVHLCEYGAQAMAVHGALKAAPERAPPGMLVSLRSVTLARDYIDDLADALRVEAVCLQASDSSQQYSFKVTHSGETIAEGRAAVLLKLPV
jgi:predicted hotdog family 3-hydroxylacyl-ACP dehydratase